MNLPKRACGAMRHEHYSDGEDTHRCGMDYDHVDQSPHRCRTCGGRWWGSGTRIVPTEPAAANAYDVMRTLFKLYAMCDDFPAEDFDAAFYPLGEALWPSGGPPL